MAKAKKPQPNFMSQKLDILHPVFLKWFAKTYPHCEKIVVFDDDNTLFSTVNGRRTCHKHLITEVLFGLKRLKPKVVLVMYSTRFIDDMQMDIQLFSDVFASFDFIITADNYAEPLLNSFVAKGQLKGQPMLLQLLRMSKPVDEVFAGYPVILIDDEVDTNWIAVEPDKHGLKPYEFKFDKPVNAKKMVQKLVRQMKNLPKQGRVFNN